MSMSTAQPARLDPERSAIVQAYMMSALDFDTIKDAAIRPALRPDQSIRLFPESGAWAPLEGLTYAPLWLPLATWLPGCVVALSRLPPGPTTFVLIALGWLVLWPLIEYGLHRFLFHAPVAWASCMPRPLQGCVNVVRLLAHTVHHAHPTDRRRIVTPLVMSALIGGLVFPPFFWLLPSDKALALAIGLVLGYVQYDWTHYYLHCGWPPADLPDWVPWKGWFCRLHKSHANHHYATLGARQSFGVAHETLDWLFGTAQ
jgi:hypothetical protein